MTVVSSRRGDAGTRSGRDGARSGASAGADGGRDPVGVAMAGRDGADRSIAVAAKQPLSVTRQSAIRRRRLSRRAFRLRSDRRRARRPRRASAQRRRPRCRSTTHPGSGVRRRERRDGASRSVPAGQLKPEGPAGSHDARRHDPAEVEHWIGSSHGWAPSSSTARNPRGGSGPVAQVNHRPPARGDRDNHFVLTGHNHGEARVTRRSCRPHNQRATAHCTGW
jgi:hypothetical protein